MHDKDLMGDPEMLMSDEGEELGPDGLPVKPIPAADDEEEDEEEEPATESDLL